MITTINESSPKHHAAKVARMLEDVANLCRSDIRILSEPKLQSVLETVAEGVLGLRKALKHYETDAPCFHPNDQKEKEALSG